MDVTQPHAQKHLGADWMSERCMYTHKEQSRRGKLFIKYEVMMISLWFLNTKLSFFSMFVSFFFKEALNTRWTWMDWWVSELQAFRFCWSPVIGWWVGDVSPSIRWCWMCSCNSYLSILQQLVSYLCSFGQTNRCSCNLITLGIHVFG